MNPNLMIMRTIFRGGQTSPLIYCQKYAAEMKTTHKLQLAHDASAHMYLEKKDQKGRKERPHGAFATWAQ